MHDAPGKGWRGAAFMLLRSYAADWRRWAGGLATRYGIAIALLVGGVLALFAAIAVGITALFDFLERTYGIEIAYAAIGGGLFVLAIVLFLIGWMMLRRKARPLPRPRRQVEAAKQMLVGPAAWRGIGANAAQTDPVTALLFGAAATLLVGWMVASRFQASRRVSR